MFIHFIGSKDKNVKSTPCLSNLPKKRCFAFYHHHHYCYHRDNNQYFVKTFFQPQLLGRYNFQIPTWMSVLWIFFSPHGTYLKRVDIPPPPPKYPVKRKESKEIPPNACGIIAFLFLVRQVRLQNGRVLVGTLQFCDCSRYHDGISTRASHERTAPHTLGSIRSTYYTEEESHTEDTRKTRQSSLENNIRGNRVPTTPSQNMEIKNNSIRATSPRSMLKVQNSTIHQCLRSCGSISVTYHKETMSFKLLLYIKRVHG